METLSLTGACCPSPRQTANSCTRWLVNCTATLRRLLSLLPSISCVVLSFVLPVPPTQKYSTLTNAIRFTFLTFEKDSLFFNLKFQKFQKFYQNNIKLLPLNKVQMLGIKILQLVPDLFKVIILFYMSNRGSYFQTNMKGVRLGFVDEEGLCTFKKQNIYWVV